MNAQEMFSTCWWFCSAQACSSPSAPASSLESGAIIARLGPWVYVICFGGGLLMLLIGYIGAVTPLLVVGVVALIAGVLIAISNE